MFQQFFQISWLAVLAGLATFFILGGLWFPLVVARAYQTALGKPQKTGILSLVGPLLCLGVITITNAWLLAALDLDQIADAAGFGLVIGTGYLLPMILNIALNPLFPRPFLYTAINAPFFIGGCCVNCVVLAIV